MRLLTRLYCTKAYAVYDVLLPVGRHYTGKDQTNGSGRDNARQRHWLARIRHRPVVVSMTKRMVDVSLALFVRLAGNSMISELLPIPT